MKNLVTGILLTFSSLSFAGDAAKLTHLGFSADGKNYAFMESGIQDGSGFAYANVRLLDVVKNAYVGAAVRVVDENDEDRVSPLPLIEARALKASEAARRNARILATNFNVLVSRKVTDMDTRALANATFSLTPIIPGLGSEQYQVRLTKSAAKVPANMNWCDEGLMLKLELVNLQNGKIKVMQQDRTMPASRGCVMNYEIEDVVVNNAEFPNRPNVVVMLRVYSLGFEGADVRYMAISGTLN
jgi:predicted secreted protein